MTGFESKEDKLYSNLMNLKSLYHDLSEFKKNPTKHGEEENGWIKIDISLEECTLDDFSSSNRFNRSIWTEYACELDLLGYNYSDRNKILLPEFERSLKSLYNKLWDGFKQIMKNIKNEISWL